ncbi:hemolysin family protein [Bifidobacterium choloepi]|uniref:HlyC/CorC family transporter n=1 Tax=Bifidobacterium choloepi TaxID=2614131 RepID=A0A6I5N0Q2_9BIFI|nr:hemolysin family protein [Bifidobacterium choloepi]NEG69239.1 HlyC/CorC family transporter [Bifidobacterium choloepi]
MEIVLVAVFVVVAVVLAWISLMMASVESAVTRVTRANVNNYMIGVQTGPEISQFARVKINTKLRKVQRLLANRHATGSACAFVRVTCNILVGVLVATTADLLGAPIWGVIVAGLVVAIAVAAITIALRPRTLGVAGSAPDPDAPLRTLIRHSTMATVALNCAPVRRHDDGRTRGGDGAELSDDEELEKLQLRQGRAAVDRLIETNRFDPEVSEMLRNVLALSDTLTREIMVPRTDMITIQRDETLEDFLKLCSRSGYSRVPVIGDDVDDLLGIAYLKDAVRATAFNQAADSRAVESIVRKAMLVPESKPADDLFHEMQQTRHHVAVVVDEYGGIAGLVTIEDAIEQIVGELEDEHDRTQHGEPKRIVREETDADGDTREVVEWSMPARTPIADVEEIFQIDLDEDDVDTVYGLLTKLVGRVPIVGATGVTHGLKFTAVDSAGRRKKVSTIVVERLDQGTGTRTMGRIVHNDSTVTDGSGDERNNE